MGRNIVTTQVCLAMHKVSNKILGYDICSQRFYAWPREIDFGYNPKAVRLYANETARSRIIVENSRHGRAWAPIFSFAKTFPFFSTTVTWKVMILKFSNFSSVIAHFAINDFASRTLNQNVLIESGTWFTSSFKIIGLGWMLGVWSLIQRFIGQT